jgi:uncharacterized phage-associated protein
MINDSIALQRNLQVQKIGNAIVYLSSRVKDLSKTKLLKLVYLLDEISIRRSGIPIFNLTYKVWKFGPVSAELYIDLSEDLHLMKNYIQLDSESKVFQPITSFCDDEFSENEIEFMDFVIEKYGNKSASELVNLTHHEHSPWHTTALANNVLEPLENETLSYTDFVIDMKQLIAHDSIRLALYNDYVAQNGYANRG